MNDTARDSLRQHKLRLEHDLDQAIIQQHYQRVNLQESTEQIEVYRRKIADLEEVLA